MSKQDKEKTVLEEIQDDVKQYSALEAFRLSEGGLILVKNGLQDIVGTVETIGNQYKTLSHTELIALCADMKAKLDFIRVLTRSTDNKELAQEGLKEALSS